MCKTSKLAQFVGTIWLYVAFITYSSGFNGVSEDDYSCAVQYVGNAALEGCIIRAEPVFLNFYPCDSWFDYQIVNVTICMEPET